MLLVFLTGTFPVDSRTIRLEVILYSRPRRFGSLIGLSRDSTAVRADVGNPPVAEREEMFDAFADFLLIIDRAVARVRPGLTAIAWSASIRDRVTSTFDRIAFPLTENAYVTG